jgi:dihydropyrimidinase
LAPVIRTEEDSVGLWRALAAGDLQTIATDHCPYTSEQKLKGQGDFRYVPGGASGVETSLRLIYTYGVRRGRFPIERLVEIMSTNPARVFNLYPRKGVIAVGGDADLVIYDEEGRSTIDSKHLHSQTDHSLYEGIEVLGKHTMTILRGEVVAQDGDLVAARPTGQLLRRKRYEMSDWA